MARASLARDLVTYGLGEVAVKAFGFITLPLYTHLFDPDQFGVVGIVLTISSLFMALIAFGSDVAYGRFFFAADSHEQRRVLTTTWIGFLAAFGLAAALAGMPFTSEIAALSTGDRDHGSLVAIAVVIAPVRLANLMMAQVLRNEFRARAYTLLNIVGLTISVGSILAAVLVLDLGIAGILVGTLVGDIAMIPVRGWFVRGMFSSHFSIKILRQLLGFGLPIVPASLAYWVFAASDRLLLSNLSTLDQVGLYSAASSIVSLTAIAVTALSQAWLPYAMQTFERDRDEAAVLFGRMLTLVLVGFGFLAVALATFAREIVDVLTGAAYGGAAAAVGPLAIGVLASATTQVTSGGITLMRRTSRLAVFAWIAAILNVGLNVLLIPAFGMMGAAAGTALTYVALTTGYAVVSNRLWPIRYDWRRSTAAGAMALGGVSGAYLLDAVVSTLGGGAILTLAFKGAYLGAFVLATTGFGLVRMADIRAISRR